MVGGWVGVSPDPHRADSIIFDLIKSRAARALITSRTKGAIQIVRFVNVVFALDVLKVFEWGNSNYRLLEKLCDFRQLKSLV